MYVHQLMDITLAVAYCDRIYTAYTHSISHANTTTTNNRAEIEHIHNNNNKIAENKLLVQKVYLTLFKVSYYHTIYMHTSDIPPLYALIYPYFRLIYRLF